MTPNQAAFLATIRFSEGTALLADPWRATFRGQNPDGTRKPMHIIGDLSDHPAITGEWPGESIAFLGPQYEHSISTAAGAYMIIKPTWLEYKTVLQMGSFNQQWQDDVALQIIKDKGALNVINAGKFVAACALLADVWASLPGPDIGQPQRTMASLVDAYRGAGGSVA